MRKTVDVVNLFVCVLAAADTVAFACAPQRWLRVADNMAANSWLRWALLLVGVLLIGWNLLVAIREYRAGVYRRDLQITTGEGTNSVSIRAIEEQLAGELRKAADVSDARVTLETRGEGVPVVCNLAFKLDCQVDVMHRVDELKRLVRETFFRIIPSGVGIEITANVLDLVGASPAAAASPAAQSEEFSGPKYPVGDGESESELL